MKPKFLQSMLRSMVIPYICKRFGSVEAFKVLKYMTEYVVARKEGIFATYELAFQIPPSEVMTRTALVSIVARIEKTDRDTIEKTVEELIKEGILTWDHQTDIIELAIDVEGFTDIYLRLKDDELFVTENKDKAEIVLLPIATRDQVSGVPDMIHLDPKTKKATIVEIHIWNEDATPY